MTVEMRDHYKYFWACTGNAIREGMFALKPMDSLRYYRDTVLE